MNSRPIKYVVTWDCEVHTFTDLKGVNDYLREITEEQVAAISEIEGLRVFEVVKELKVTTQITATVEG